MVADYFAVADGCLPGSQDSFEPDQLSVSEEKKKMLMITEQRNDCELTFRLAGALAGDWALELERCWRDATASDATASDATASDATASDEPLRLMVDLTEVIFVDETGKKLLALMAKAGASFLAGDVLMKSIVEEIVNEETILY